MVAFTAAIVVGLAAGNSAGTILFRAMVVMIVCWMAGRVVGGFAQKFTEKQIEEYRAKNPIVAIEATSASAGEQATNTSEESNPGTPVNAETPRQVA